MKLKAASAKPDAPEDQQVKTTRELGHVWDSVGWLYFRQGKYEQAQRFLHAAWLLSQDPTTGDHLGQLLEQQGKKSEAAHVYKLAYACLPIRPDEKQAILEHYKRVMGKDADPSGPLNNSQSRWYIYANALRRTEPYANDQDFHDGHALWRRYVLDRHFPGESRNGKVCRWRRESKVAARPP